MNYLIKIDDWTKDYHDYVIVKNNVELISVLQKMNYESIVNVTPLNGTVYQTAEFIND